MYLQELFIGFVQGWMDAKTTDKSTYTQMW